MLELPRIDEQGLRLLAICAHIDLAPDAPSICDDEVLIAKIGDRENRLLARRVVDSDEECCHFHVEVGVETAIPAYGDPGTVEDVLQVPQGLYGGKHFVTSWGRFRMNRADVSERSIIRALSATEVPVVDGYRLNLTGCSLDVLGDGPVKELRWWPVSEEAIGLEVTVHCELRVDDRLLVEADRIIGDGLGVFARIGNKE